MAVAGDAAEDVVAVEAGVVDLVIAARSKLTVAGGTRVTQVFQVS
jgi:hypothetical protein